VAVRRYYKPSLEKKKAKPAEARIRKFWASPQVTLDGSPSSASCGRHPLFSLFCSTPGGGAISLRGQITVKGSSVCLFPMELVRVFGPVLDENYGTTIVRQSRPRGCGQKSS
jgi:hypothetical protein